MLLNAAVSSFDATQGTSKFVMLGDTGHATGLPAACLDDSEKQLVEAYSAWPWPCAAALTGGT